MAFEQSQKTRVESKQYSGDWAGFMAPQGNGGHATEMYHDTEPVNFRSFDNAIEYGADYYVESEKSRIAAEKEQRKVEKEKATGRYLEELRVINETIPDGSKREEAVKRLSEKYINNYGFSMSDIQSGRKATGNAWEQGAQARLEDFTRQSVVENRKELAKIGTEMRPSLLGRPIEEQVKAGAEIQQMRNEMESAVDILFNPNVGADDKRTALKTLVGCVPSTMTDEQLTEFFAHPEMMTSKDVTDLANGLSAAWIQQGHNPSEARVIAGRVANEFYTKSKQQQNELNKMDAEEKELYIKNTVASSRINTFEYFRNAQPQITPGMSEKEKEAAIKQAAAMQNIGLTLALHGMQPDESFVYHEQLKHIDPTKYDFYNGVRRWKGPFDIETASFGVDHGTPQTTVAALQGMSDEAFKTKTPAAIKSLQDALMSPNVKDIFLRIDQGPALDNAKDVILGTEQKMLEQEIRSYVLPTTSAVGETGQVRDLGHWNTREQINGLIDNARARLRYYGATDEDQVKVINDALAGLGIKRETTMTNPEELYEYAKEKFREYGDKHFFKYLLKGGITNMIQDFPGKTLGEPSVIINYKRYKKGDITKEEFVDRTLTALADIAEPEEESGEVEQAPTLEQVQESVFSSPEFLEAFESVRNDQSIQSIDEKSEKISETFRNMVDSFTNGSQNTNNETSSSNILGELFGVKSANAKELNMDMAPRNWRDADKYTAHHVGKTKAKNNITNIKGKNSNKFKSFNSVQQCLAETGYDVEKKLERYSGDVFGLCNQYAPRSDRNLPSRYCAAILYRTPGVSAEDKQRLQEIVSDITNNYKEDGTKASARKRDREYEEEIKRISSKYKDIFYKDGKPQMVGPIVSVIALMETGSRIEYVG